MSGQYNAKPNPAKRKPGTPLTDAEKKRIDTLLAEGKTHRAICDELGIGTSTLSKYKKDTGQKSTPRHDNSAGTQAFARDAAAKRASRVAALDELFEKRATMLRRVAAGEERYKTILKIPGGGEMVENLSFVPAADWRSEISALSGIGNAIDRADDRADDGGLARAQSMLQMVLLAAAKASHEVPADEGVFEE